MKKVIVFALVFFVMAISPVPVSEAEEPRVPSVNWFLKETVPIELGVTNYGISSNLYMKYLEKPNDPGKVVGEKKDVFLNSWVIFKLTETQNGSTYPYRNGKHIKPIHLVLRIWIYDPEKKEKTCFHCEMAEGQVRTTFYTDDESNVILRRGPIVTLEKKEKGFFKTEVADKVIEQFIERLKKNKNIAVKTTQAEPETPIPNNDD